MRWLLGPVSAAECVTTSRRWQVYAGRFLLVSSVLAAMTLIWLTRSRRVQPNSIQENAVVGSALVDAIMAVELVLAIAIVPAAAAGAICHDKMSGGLTLMTLTDLSDAEIVLGKLASRLVTILGIVSCGLPVLAILTSLGGVDPIAILAGSMVIVGVAVLGVTLALTFSVWATRPHDLGKWRGSFRAVPRLAILPAIIALGSALMGGTVLAAVLFAALIAALLMAYGAVITSLGLALATWQPRLGRAVGLSVAAFLAVTVVYPTFAIMTFNQLGPHDMVFPWVSPFFGMFIPMGWAAWPNNNADAGGYIAMFIWIDLTSAVACALLQMTIASFDRLLGRMPIVRTAITDGPWPRSLSIGQPRQAHRSPR